MIIKGAKISGSCDASSFLVKSEATIKPRTEIIRSPRRETRATLDNKSLLSRFAKTFALSFLLMGQSFFAHAQLISFDCHIPVKVAAKVLLRHDAAAVLETRLRAPPFAYRPVGPTILIFPGMLILLLKGSFPPGAHSLRPCKTTKGNPRSIALLPRAMRTMSFLLFGFSRCSFSCAQVLLLRWISGFLLF